MKKKKIVIPQNYLEKIPVRVEAIKWSQNEKGEVTLEIENKGWANRIAQKLFKRPKFSFVHLDEMGNFIWPLIDGEKDIIALGSLVEKEFGENANPLYERPARYFQILESYRFITFK